MAKKQSLAFGNFLGKIREKEAQREGRKITTTEMANKVGISQAHWYRAEKNGYILSQQKIKQIIRQLHLDPVTGKILLAHAGYPNRDTLLLDQASRSLVDTQAIMAEIFYDPGRIGIIKSVVTSWLDPELEIAEYTRHLCMPWQDVAAGFPKEEILKFVKARKLRQQKYRAARIASQFIILETILEKSVLLPNKFRKKQIEYILDFMEKNNFLEIRLLQPGPRCSIPMCNFRLYSNVYLWLGYMYYGEVVCGEMEPLLLRQFDNFFYDYWNKSLSKEKTIKRMSEWL